MDAEQETVEPSATRGGQLPTRILDQFRGIESTPGVCGGDARIAGTRIPVWILQQSREMGRSEAEILDDYPGLCAADLVAAWAYFEEHAEEINEDIRLNDEDESEDADRGSERPSSRHRAEGVPPRSDLEH